MNDERASHNNIHILCSSLSAIYNLFSYSVATVAENQNRSVILIGRNRM